jgi:hypothetical protein
VRPECQLSTIETEASTAYSAQRNKSSQTRAPNATPGVSPIAGSAAVDLFVDPLRKTVWARSRGQHDAGAMPALIGAPAVEVIELTRVAGYL